MGAESTKTGTASAEPGEGTEERRTEGSDHGCMSRREFLRMCTAVAALGLVPPCVSWALEGGGTRSGKPRTVVHSREAMFQQALDGERVKCLLCPFECVLKNGETGPCRTRRNEGGRLVTSAWNDPAICELAPIEKNPLFHFLPGARTVALGCAGCNLHCAYCQNWELSQRSPFETNNMEMSADDVCTFALREKTPVVTFTYTEPVVFFEYAEETARRARDKGLLVTAATASFISPGPLDRLCGVLDAVTVTLKGFSEKFYSKMCGAHLKPVLDAMVRIKDAGCWLEAANLLVPGYNDSPEEVGRLAAWMVKHLGADTPLFIMRFVPVYKLSNLMPTPVPVLEDAVKAALDAGLNFVYLSNVAPHKYNHTWCPSCGAKLVERLGFKILSNAITPDGKCPRCGRSIPGKWRR